MLMFVIIILLLTSLFLMILDDLFLEIIQIFQIINFISISISCAMARYDPELHRFTFCKITKDISFECCYKLLRILFKKLTLSKLSS